VGFALSLFGLVATIGLATYNARNDQLYFELVGRAAAIERSLDLPDGAFANSPVHGNVSGCRAWSGRSITGRPYARFMARPSPCGFSGR